MTHARHLPSNLRLRGAGCAEARKALIIHSFQRHQLMPVEWKLW